LISRRRRPRRAAFGGPARAAARAVNPVASRRRRAKLCNGHQGAGACSFLTLRAITLPPALVGPDADAAEPALHCALSSRRRCCLWPWNVPRMTMPDQVLLAYGM
jgi:hypothetical protein